VSWARCSGRFWTPRAASCTLLLPRDARIKVRKDTRTRQDRYLAIEETTTALLTQRREASRLHSVASEPI
jgi:hypothetical protein